MFSLFITRLIGYNNLIEILSGPFVYVELSCDNQWEWIKGFKYFRYFHLWQHIDDNLINNMMDVHDLLLTII